MNPYCFAEYGDITVLYLIFERVGHLREGHFCPSDEVQVLSLINRLEVSI